jgi:hypothetical protein
MLALAVKRAVLVHPGNWVIQKSKLSVSSWPTARIRLRYGEYSSAIGQETRILNMWNQMTLENAYRRDGKGRFGSSDSMVITRRSLRRPQNAQAWLELKTSSCQPSSTCAASALMNTP